MGATRPPVKGMVIPPEGLPCGCGDNDVCPQHLAIARFQGEFLTQGEEYTRRALLEVAQEITTLAEGLAAARLRRQQMTIAARWGRVLALEEIADRAGFSNYTVISKLCLWARKGFPPVLQEKGVR